MQNTKLVQILKKFSDEEWKGYEKLVDSPYFNKGRSYIPLLKELRKFRPDFKHPKLTNEHIYSLIYKGKPYNNSTFKSMLSGLVSLAEVYLMIKGFSKNKRLGNVLLLKELRLKNLYGLYDSLMRSSEKNYGLEGNVEIRFFYDIIAFESEKGYGYGQRADYKNYFKSNVKETNAVMTGALLTLFETIQSETDMKLTHGITEQNTLVREFEKVINFETLVKNLKKNNSKYYEIVALPYYLYAASCAPGDINLYYKCRDYLFGNYKLYSKKQLFSFLIHLESLCISKIEPKNKRAEEAMKIYGFMFDKDILSFSEEEHTPLMLFRNVIFMTLLPFIEWTDAFVFKHLPKLAPQSRNSMKYLWEVHKCFLLKDYRGVLKHTHKIDINLLFLKLDVKLFYLIAYYELGYFEEARSMTDTFYKYLKQNNDIAEIIVEKHLNYIKIFKKLLKMKETGDISGSKELEKKINSAKYIIKRLWLLEKIEEL